MKKGILFFIAVLSTTLAVRVKAGDLGDFSLTATDVVAPVVYDRTKLLEAPAGTIVYDANVSSTAAGFYALPPGVNPATNGNWTRLGPAAVTSGGSIRVEVAKVAAAGTVSSESSDWINGSCSVTSSVYTCTLNSTFGAAPVCTCSIEQTGDRGCNITSTATGSVVVNTFITNSGAPDDEIFHLQRIGSQ